MTAVSERTPATRTSVSGRAYDRKGIRMMRRYLTLLAAAAVQSAAPAPAVAQLRPEVQTGSILPTKPQALEAKETAIIGKHLAECVYQRAKRKAEAFLAHSDISAVDFAGAGIRDVATELDMTQCLDGEVGPGELELGMELQPTALRDLLAEEDYLAKNHLPPQLPANAQPGQFIPAATDNHISTAQALASFSDCTIRNDLHDADALLRTTPGTDEERHAAAALAPSLGSCLTSGQQVALTPGRIRGLIAYALWSRFAR
jgi:hypothetical protein